MQNNNNKYPIRILKLLFGLFLYALGIVMTIRGNVGLSPWDVFHQGVSLKTGMTMGTASIVVGFFIVGICFFAGEKIGVGTVLNMFLIGIFLDILLYLGLIPLMNGFLPGAAMMIGGLFIIGFGSYFYIGAGFGAGPRDSLMVLLVRKFSVPVGAARFAVEGSVLVAGWLLGGFVGLGTALSVVCIGAAVQLVFKALKFDVKAVKQESIADTIRNVKNKTGM